MRFILFALVCSAVCAFAADDTTQSQLLEIDSAFVTGQYSRVELLTLRLLQSGAELTPQERSRVNLTAGYSLIMLDRESEARDYFLHALDAEPDLTLDPVQVSPKFRMVFDEVKATYRAQGQKSSPLLSRASTVSAPRASVMLSNLIIPGSGQWREGRRLRGAVYFAAQAASVGALIWSVNELRDSHEDYLAETDPARIGEAYDTYNSDYTLAWGAGILAAAVYLAAQADLVLFRPEQTPVEFGVNFTPSRALTISAHW